MNGVENCTLILEQLSENKFQKLLYEDREHKYIAFDFFLVNFQRTGMVEMP